MSMLPQKTKIYDDGRTEQGATDETDINRILARANVAGTMSHLQKYEGVYGDFAGFDFATHQKLLTQAREIFDDLPAELRQEFAHSPSQFFDYVNDPNNVDKLRELLPRLAKPGQQLMSVRPATADETPLGVAREATPTETTTTEVETTPETPTPSPDTQEG